jgi:hypothetical protein
MAQAKTRDSTPPTNTSPTRRKILGTIAAAATVVAAKPAGSAGIGPIAPDDPIYAAIERHKAAVVPWDAAIDVRADFPESACPTDEEWEQRDTLDDAVDDARDTLEETGADLVNTAPTTLAGITTAIRYMQTQMRNDGAYMPYEIDFQFDPGYPGDGAQVLGWIDAFLDTLADATAALDMAVLS